MRALIEAVYDRYEEWASARMHLHFYVWESLGERLDIDMVPIPAPAWLDRAMPTGFWRFSFDS